MSGQGLPGVQNIEADWVIRHVASDWELSPLIFKSLNKVWGPMTLHLFASRHNTQLRRYVSWRPDPFTMVTDAFQTNWSGGLSYAFPPFALIDRCLAKILKDQRRVVITAMVHNPIGDVSGGSHSSSSRQRSADIPNKLGPPANSSKQHDTSGLDGFLEQALSKGVSSDAAKLFADYTWHKGTKSAYNSAWRQWSSWCCEREIDPFQAPVPDIYNLLLLSFLTKASSIVL